MPDFGRNQLIAALMAAATALFVFSGQPSAAHWRRKLRYATLAVYIAAAAVAVIAVIVWLADGR